MSNGYIKLHRKLLESEVFQHAEILRLFIYLLLRTSFKKQSFSIPVGKGSTIVSIKAGQTLYGRKKVATELSVPESSVRNWMEKLEKYEMISINSFTNYSIVTVNNWSTYQNNEFVKDSNRTTEGLPLDTYNKDKKEEEYDESFLEFWNAYPKKANQHGAYKEWLTLNVSDELLRQILSGIERAKLSDQWKNPKYIPNPANWLKDQRWEDQIDSVNSKEPAEQEVGKPTFYN